MFEKRLSPGLTLLLLGPICGELLSGHQSLFEFVNPLAFVLTSLPYGFGAIICRELTVRWRKGWFSLVLLGIAYGLFEEFVVARSVWDPSWAELGAIRDYSYWHGLTWTYAEVLLHFHLTVSILTPVILTELLFPERRGERWVTNRQLAGCFVGLGLWIPVLWLINPFTPPAVGFVLTWLGMIGLLALAWALPARVLPGRPGTSTRPLWYAVVAAVNMTVVFLAVFMLPEISQRWLPPWPVMFAFVALADAILFGLVLIWSGNGTTWDDRHKLALVVGFLAFFLVFDVLQSFAQGLLVAVGAAWAVRKLWNRVQARMVGTETMPPVGTV